MRPKDREIIIYASENEDLKTFINRVLELLMIEDKNEGLDK